MVEKLDYPISKDYIVPFLVHMTIKHLTLEL